MWLCGLAYWQILLIRDEDKNAQPAMYPAKTNSDCKSYTIGQVQRDTLRILITLGTPASPPRIAGKGKDKS